MFWNLKGKPLWMRLASIIARHDVDIVMLAECPEMTAECCLFLSEQTKRNFHIVPGQSPRLRLLTRLPEEAFSPVFDDLSGRLMIRRLRLKEPRVDILLALVHLQSKLHHAEEDQRMLAMELARDIGDHEARFAHARTVLVGDFNMNPFEPGVVGASGLHAVMTRAIAEKGTRTVSSRESRYFYNPMWSYFGDRSEGPPGTYYYRKSTPICYFWNMFDQVLLRPDIVHWLKDLRILDHDGSTSLLDKLGQPDSETASDHLPLYFRLNP